MTITDLQLLSMVHQRAQLRDMALQCPALALKPCHLGLSTHSSSSMGERPMSDGRTVPRSVDSKRGGWRNETDGDEENDDAKWDAAQPWQEGDRHRQWRSDGAQPSGHTEAGGWNDS